jgi:hypothetical protein
MQLATLKPADNQNLGRKVAELAGVVTKEIGGRAKNATKDVLAKINMAPPSKAAVNRALVSRA